MEATQSVDRSVENVLKQGEFQPIPLEQISIIARPDFKNRDKQLFFNPRYTRGFEQVPMAELEDSIATDGLLTPLAVRPSANGYELIAGERRTRAIRSLVERDQPVWDEQSQDHRPASQVYQTVMCRIVGSVDDRRAIRVAFAENDRHVPLSDADVLELCDRLEQMAFSRKEIGEILGKSASWVNMTFRFLSELEPDILEKLRQGRISRHCAMKILDFPEDAREELISIAEAIASERHQAAIEELDEELAEAEEALDEATVSSLLAEEEGDDEERSRADRKAERATAAVEKVSNKKEEVESKGAKLKGSDLDAAARSKGIKGGGDRRLSSKVIITRYIQRAKTAIDGDGDVGVIDAPGKFRRDHLEVAAVVANGIAQGEDDLFKVLKDYYDANRLWVDADQEAIAELSQV